MICMFNLLDRCSDFFRAPRFYECNVRRGTLDQIAQALKAIYDPHNASPFMGIDNGIVHTPGCRPTFCHAGPPEYSHIFQVVCLSNPSTGPEEFLNEIFRIMVNTSIVFFKPRPASEFFTDNGRAGCFSTGYSSDYIRFVVCRNERRIL